MSSGGQWEALPQRRRKRRPTAAADFPPHLPQHQQQQQQDTKWPSAPTRPPDATGALAATPDLASGDHNHQPSSAIRKDGTCSTGISTENTSHPQQQQQQHQQQRDCQQDQKQQPCENSDSSDQVGGIPPTSNDEAKQAAAIDGGGGVAGLSDDKGSASATTATATAPTPTPSAPAGAAVRTRRTTQRGQAGGEGEGRGRGGAGVNAPDAETVAARHAAVAMAVEARSKMTRFAGGLEGGAGADGGSAGANFEYLDHTADVQLHSWGESIERAMEGALAAMFNTITDIAKVDVDPSLTRVMEVEGHDAKSLLFSFLDEFLFLFHSEGLAVKRTTVNGTVDRGSGPNPRWRLKATAEGETFDLSKHPQGTEVKAITYSNMQINEAADGRTDIYVIVDI